jgi:hypothetical protein
MTSQSGFLFDESYSLSGVRRDDGVTLLHLHLRTPNLDGSMAFFSLLASREGSMRRFFGNAKPQEASFPRSSRSGHAFAFALDQLDARVPKRPAKVHG